MSHGIEIEPLHIPNLARVNEVGKGLFNNPARFATAVALGIHFTLEDNVGINASQLALATQRPYQATLGHLQVLQVVGLVKHEKPSYGHPRLYRAVVSPAWSVIHQAVEAIGPTNTVPTFEPEVLGLSPAIILQKRLFGRRLLPFMGMHLAGMSEASHPVGIVEFTQNWIIGNTTQDAVLSAYGRLTDLGMVKRVVTGEPATEPLYMPTDSPLLNIFRALSSLLPEELQPDPA